MDLLLVLAIPIVLALAALRWGVDSRERLLSEEARLARYGVAWHEPTDGDAPPPVRREPRRVPCRAESGAVENGVAA